MQQLPLRFPKPQRRRCADVKGAGIDGVILDIECGKGSNTKEATPCCACELDFAGEGCAELDARMYVAIFVLTIAALMPPSMLLIPIGRRSIPQLKRPSRDGTEMTAKYQEPLLS